MTDTLLRRRKDKIYGIVPSGSDYYAFWEDGRAGLYIDGTFVSYRSTGGPTIAEVPSLIHTDSEDLVGDGSIAFRSGVSDLEVWDVANEASYDYAAIDDWHVTPPIYDSGWLWWIEREPAQHGGVGTHATDLRLMRARADFSAPEVVDTYELEHYLGFSVLWGTGPSPKFALTADSGIVQLHWNDEAAGEVQGDINVRIGRSGGGSDSGWPVIAPTGTVVDVWPFLLAPPADEGFATSAITVGGGATFLASQEDDVEASPVALWPNEEVWQAGGCVNVSLSADGSEGAVFDGGQLVRGPATLTGGGSPTAHFAVDVSPADDRPNYFFIKG